MDHNKAQITLQWSVH